MSARHRCTLFVLISLFAADTCVRAAEITGTVSGVSGSTATIKTDGGTPAVGDSVEIFFKLPGMDDEISVATGSVVKVEGDSVQVKIESSTGDVAQDQLARIKPGAAQKLAGPSASSTTTPAIAPSPTATATQATAKSPQASPSAAVVPPTPTLDPSFAFVDLNRVFKNFGKTKNAEAKINAAKAEAKKEYDRRLAAHEADLPVWRANKETQLQEEAQKLRETLVEEITTMVKAMTGDVGLVIDQSGMSQNGVPVAMFTPADADMSTRISAALATNQAGDAFAGTRDLQVGLVDANRIFRELDRTKKAEAQINAKKNTAKAEYDKRAAAYSKQVASVSAMPEGKQREKAAASVRAKEKEINEWRARKEKELQDQALGLREDIVKAMGETIQARLAGKSAPLILDASGLSMNGNPIVFWSAGIPDLSDEVIAALNGPASKTKTPASLLSSTNLKLACVDLRRALESVPEGKQIDQELRALAEKAQQESATADVATQEAKQKELSELASQKFGPLKEKLTKEVGRIGSAAGYNLIINSAAHTLNNTPWVIITRSADITDQVISALMSER